MSKCDLIRALDTALELNAPVDVTAIEQLTLAGWWVLTRLIATQRLTPQQAAAVMFETIVIAVEEMGSESELRTYERMN